MSMNLSFRTGINGLLFALFCLFSNIQLNAQDIQSAEAFNASIKWKSSSEATQLLLIRIDNMNAQLGGFQVGSQPYDNVLRRVAYYKAILDELEDGKTLGFALDDALQSAATLGNTKDVSYTPKAVLRAIHEETRLFLTNN